MTETVIAPALPPAAERSLGWGRTRRLALREFAPQDEQALVEMHRDARLREHLVDDYPLQVSAVSRLFVERIGQIYRRHEGLGIWHASLLEPEPAFAGWFSLMPIPAGEARGEVEIGSRLLPRVWGSGLALEGGEVLLDHAFDDLGLDHVWGICHPDNRSARAVLAALGFEPLGLRRYDDADALHHRIALNAWRALRNIPRGTRLRRALRSQGRGAAVHLSEETPHAHEVDPRRDTR
jgi:RimJ/RimL family protein N-acetyltransferase